MVLWLRNHNALFMMAVYYRVRIYQKYFFNYWNKILKILPRIRVKEKWGEYNSPWGSNAISLINKGSALIRLINQERCYLSVVDYRQLFFLSIIWSGRAGISAIWITVILDLKKFYFSLQYLSTSNTVKYSQTVIWVLQTELFPGFPKPSTWILCTMILHKYSY